MKLYEIANEYLALVEAIENEEIPEEAVADTLEAITAEIEDKADNIACLMKSLNAEALAIREEEKRLAKRRQAKERVAERCKEYLSDMLLKVGIDKMETVRNKITFRKSEAVEVDEAAFINWAMTNRDDLLTYSAPTANKTEIKKALKDGVEIVGAVLRVNQNIQIK
jgi:hypothetical protein